MILAVLTPEAAQAGSVIGLAIFVTIALGVSFLCSILEAVLLSTSASYLEVAIQQGSKAALKMRDQKDKEHIDRSISAILTLNTIAHTVGAAGAGAEAAAIFESVPIGVIGAVLTFLILVVSEIIPKTLGVVYWKLLMPASAYAISWLVIVLFPVVWSLQWLTELLKPKTEEPTVTRSELEIMARLGHEEGTIGEREKEVVHNVLRHIREKQATDILTPRTVLTALKASQTVGAVAQGPPLKFSRIPIFEGDHDQIAKFVLRHDIFEAAATGREQVALEEISRPLKTVPATISVAKLLEMFVNQREHIFLVVDEYGGTEGIVTLEDAIESLLGAEIIDESDPATDMQEMARRQAARRRRTPTPSDPSVNETS